MLTLSEAEHGAYHNGNVSDVPCRSVSSTRIGSMDYTDAPDVVRGYWLEVSGPIPPHTPRLPGVGIIPPRQSLQIERRGIIIVSKIR